MAQPPKTATIPPGLDLDANYTLQFTAIDATSGAILTTVNISDATLLVANVVGGDLGTFDILPPIYEYDEPLG